MNIKELRLELHDIADELDAVVYNDWLAGDVSPFRDKARRLREISRKLSSVEPTRGTGDFRDEPWEPR